MTTRALLAGAREELAAVGQAAFTMDGVARRSFFSAGALYERWADRGDLLADVGREVQDEIEVILRGLPDAPAALAWVLDDGRDLIELAGEILIAGHTTPAVRDVATSTWLTLRDGLERHLPRGMAWYTSCVSVGGALLDVLCLPGPTPPTGRVMYPKCHPRRAQIPPRKHSSRPPRRSWPSTAPKPSRRGGSQPLPG